MHGDREALGGVGGTGPGVLISLFFNAVRLGFSGRPATQVIFGVRSQESEESFGFY